MLSWMAPSGWRGHSRRKRRNLHMCPHTPIFLYNAWMPTLQYTHSVVMWREGYSFPWASIDCVCTHSLCFLNLLPHPCFSSQTPAYSCILCHCEQWTRGKIFPRKPTSLFFLPLARDSLLSYDNSLKMCSMTTSFRGSYFIYVAQNRSVVLLFLNGIYEWTRDCGPSIVYS